MNYQNNSFLLKSFQNIQSVPDDIVFGVTQKFLNDKSSDKINGFIGTYVDKEGNSIIFNVVRSVEESFKDKNLTNNYLPLEGMISLAKPTQKLVFSSQSSSYRECRIASVQSLSGTGALAIAGRFAHDCLGFTTAYVSDPTWGNHIGILKSCSFDVKTYPYWNQKKHCLCIQDMLEALRQASCPSLVILQNCAHNPTGIDPSKKQWNEILQVIMEKQHLTLFDNAYQGCSSGDVEEDAYAIRLFDSHNLPLLVAQSFAKNMGMYGHRIGMLHVTCPSQDKVPIVMGWLKKITRVLNSSPPMYGAFVVDQILGSDSLRTQWLDEMKNTFVKDLQLIRTLLYEKLLKEKVQGYWHQLPMQRGLFFLSDILKDKCEILAKEHHVYILPSGRISLAGLRKSNLDYFVSALKKTLNTM